MLSRRTADGSLALTPEEPHDLLALRRAIRAGDSVTASTTRAIRAEREHARPDRGERVRIRLRIDVEDVLLDSVLGRLRIRGRITESDNESVSRGSSHSVVVVPGDRIAVSKKAWSALDRRLLGASRRARGYVLVSVDSRECGIARLAGTHLRILPNIYSGAGGKRYKVAADPRAYYAEIRAAASACASAGDALIVFGPGREKERAAAALAGAEGLAAPVLAEGIDSGGEDGIHLFAKSEALRRAIPESKLARVLGIVEEAMRLAGTGSGRFAAGREGVGRAVGSAAASSIVFSDRLIAEAGEEAAVDLLNAAEAGGTDVYAADESTDVGMRVSGMGGVIALLRFSMG